MKNENLVEPEKEKDSVKCKHKNWHVSGRINSILGAAQERKCDDCGLIIIV